MRARRPRSPHSVAYRGASLTRKRTPLGPYRRPTPRVLGHRGVALSYGRGTPGLRANLSTIDVRLRRDRHLAHYTLQAATGGHFARARAGGDSLMPEIPAPKGGGGVPPKDSGSRHHAPYTLHPTPYTQHPIPYTLHPTPYTIHPTPYTLTLYTLHSSPYTLHPTPYTLYPTPYTLYPTPFTPHPIPYNLHPQPSTPNPTPQILNPKP